MMMSESRLTLVESVPRWAVAVLGLALAACTGSGIWNAGDLAVWVKDRAVEQGCQRDSIQLEEWYTETAEGNVWRGPCRDAQGNPQSFGVDVDPVWTPSKSAS
jgi:hypothetical protein